MNALVKGIQFILLFLVCLILISCKSVALRPNPGTTSISDMRTIMRNAIAEDRITSHRYRVASSKSINSALMPPLSVNSSNDNNKAALAERFNISVNNESAQAFFMGLVKGTQYNIVVSPKITGTISLNLKNVTIPEVLEAVHDAYGYDFEKTPYGFRINPPGLETRIFSVNYLDIIRNGNSSTVVSSGGITGREVSGTTSTSLSTGTSTSSTNAQTSSAASLVNTRTESNFWETMKLTLTAMVGEGDGKQIIINPESGTIAVTAYPKQIREVARYLDAVQNTMTREVIIDAKILEVKLNKDFQAGIDWNILGFKTNTSQTFNSDGSTFLSTFTSLLELKGSAGGANHKRFSGVVNALSNQGDVQVLSSPRVATLNNQKAVIKIGNDEFFVTDVSSSTLGSAGGTETTQNVELTPFFSGISLDVTPEISSDDSITLHIHPVVSTVTEKDKAFTTGGEAQDLPLAFSTIREADTIVHAKNNQIIIIGGLMEHDTEEKISGVPFLDKIPFLGVAFRRQQQEAVKRELVILLRPTVVKNNSWETRLREISERFKSLDIGGHFGPHPEAYGNLGETDGYRDET